MAILFRCECDGKVFITFPFYYLDFTLGSLRIFSLIACYKCDYTIRRAQKTFLSNIVALIEDVNLIQRFWIVFVAALVSEAYFSQERSFMIRKPATGSVKCDKRTACVQNVIQMISEWIAIFWGRIEAWESTQKAWSVRWNGPEKFLLLQTQF